VDSNLMRYYNDLFVRWDKWFNGRTNSTVKKKSRRFLMNTLIFLRLASLAIYIMCISHFTSVLLYKAWISYVQVVDQVQEQVIRFSSRDNLNNTNFDLCDHQQVGHLLQSGVLQNRFST
jgi:hypothetical protein